jgi:hypothetical protein
MERTPRFLPLLRQPLGGGGLGAASRCGIGTARCRVGGRRLGRAAVLSPTGLVSSRRHLEPCVRFSRTRLSDVIHRLHSASPARPGWAGVRRRFRRGRSGPGGSGTGRPDRPAVASTPLVAFAHEQDFFTSDLSARPGTPAQAPPLRGSASTAEPAHGGALSAPDTGAAFGAPCHPARE